jgi:hypothetical protein
MTMKFVYLFIFIFSATLSYGQFHQYFEDNTLRMDYAHSGNFETEHYAFSSFKKEDQWAGSQINLIDDFEYGKYLVKVYDSESGKMIYSRGYGSLFHEWSGTEEAKTLLKSFEETVIIPFPKKKILISLYSRNKKMEFEEKFNIAFDPKSTSFNAKNDFAAPVIEINKNGSMHKKIDIVILPEGYSENDYEKFLKDCNTLFDQMFSFEPFKSLKENFNTNAVWAPSKEGGTDDPVSKKEVSTAFNTSFNTFYSDRYCMTLSHHKVRDYAANSPYDQIYILVNTDKYGGGAIYNFYSISVSGNLNSPKVFIHEFGHAFAGLADEYAYEDSFENMYEKGVEPWEPNITTLVNFDKKWKNILEKDIPVPTPSTKEYVDKHGVFEGAGYQLKGVYRPKQDCMMRSFDRDVFCDVCQRAIEDMVRFYSE